MLIESKTSGWKSLQLFCLPLLILLCSKYYFLFGFFPGTWRPIAPTWLVLTRDFIFFGFLSWGFFQISSLGIKKNFGQVWLENLRAIKTFYILLSFACLAIIIQLFGIKTLAEISQHYVRNAFLPILIFPMVLLYAGAYPKLLDLLPTFRIFMFLSVIVSLLQIFIWHDLMWINRPTGLMGDPLLNSVFILIGLLSFEFEKTVQRTLFAILILPAGFVLYQANSLSAVFAFLMGLVLTAGDNFLIYRASKKH